MPPMIEWNWVLTAIVAVFAYCLVRLVLVAALRGLSRGLYWVSEHIGTEDERRRMRLRNRLATYSQLVTRR